MGSLNKRKSYKIVNEKGKIIEYCRTKWSAIERRKELKRNSQEKLEIICLIKKVKNGKIK